MKEAGGSRVAWRTVADVAALIACLGAAAWVAAGGERAFLLANVDLGFHELGHLLFALAPGLAAPMAGSIAQVAVPLALAIYFAIRRESYACALMFAWAATSAANVAVYIADAPVQALPLLGGGRHDWAWILGSTGHMGWSGWLASTVRWAGVVLAGCGAIVATSSLIAPHARERTEERREAKREAREAELRARAPRREPRNRMSPSLPVAHGKAAPPAAPAGRL
jgi:signal transduction histidine kinase